MQAKRRAILANQIKRKERIMARSEEKEVEEHDRLQTKLLRMEHAVQRRMEREQRRFFEFQLNISKDLDTKGVRSREILIVVVII